MYFKVVYSFIKGFGKVWASHPLQPSDRSSLLPTGVHDENLPKENLADPRTPAA